MAQQPPARKQPIGRPLKWTPSQLDALATISQADIEAARVRVDGALSAALPTEDDSGHPYTLRAPADLWTAAEGGG